MKTALRLLWIVLLMLLVFYIGRALLKKAQVRGFVSGAKAQLKLVTDKAVLTSSDGEDKVYYLAWDSADIRTRGPNRIALPKRVWTQHALGDQVEILYFDGDTRPYHRESIYASNLQLVACLIFLYFTLALIAYYVFEIITNSSPADIPAPTDFSKR